MLRNAWVERLGIRTTSIGCERQSSGMMHVAQQRHLDDQGLRHLGPWSFSMESVDITMDHSGGGVLSESYMRHPLRIVQELWRLGLYRCALVKSAKQVNLSHHLCVWCLLQTGR
jgi:hypothetical protein